MLTIIASMEDEIVGLRRELLSGNLRAGTRPTNYADEILPVQLQVVGLGRNSAETSVRQLLSQLQRGSKEREEPSDGLLLLGFAGAVDADLRTGDLVLASRYYCPETADSQSSESNTETRGTIYGYRAPDSAMWGKAVEAAGRIGQPVVNVDSLTVDSLVTTPEEKQALARRYPVGIVEMEDYWVAVAARESGVPFLSARVVLDPARQGLPGYLPGLARSRSRARAAVAVAAMPWRIPAIFGLARRLPAAKRELTRFALSFLELLVDSEAAPSRPAAARSSVG